MEPHASHTHLSKTTSALHATIEKQYGDWMDLRQQFKGLDKDVELYSKEFPKKYLLDILHHVEIYQPIPVTSHRKILGPLIVLAKRCLLRFLRPLVKLVFVHQISLNRYLFHLAVAHVMLEDRVNQLTEQIKLLQSKNLDG